MSRLRCELGKDAVGLMKENIVHQPISSASSFLRVVRRPLATLRTEEFDDFLWFYTAADSHKIAEIRKPHPVNLKLEGLVRAGASDATIATGFVFSDITPSQP